MHYETEYEIEDANGNWIMSLEGVTKDNARFIVLACNHFEELRDIVQRTANMTPAFADFVQADAKRLLAKLEEADAD